MIENHAHEHDMADHARKFSAFLAGVVANIFGVAFVLLALVAFAFGNSFSTVLGWGTILIGNAMILIDLWTGNRRWLFSLATLAVLGLITVVNVA